MSVLSPACCSLFVVPIGIPFNFLHLLFVVVVVYQQPLCEFVCVTKLKELRAEKRRGNFQFKRTKINSVACN